MAQYEQQRGIANETAFNYWDPHVLKKRDANIYLVKNRKPQYLKCTHKFGVELPKYVADTHAIEKKNRKTFWTDGIAKEVKNFGWRSTSSLMATVSLKIINLSISI